MAKSAANRQSLACYNKFASRDLHLALGCVTSQDLFTLQPGSLQIVASDFDARPMSAIDADGQRIGYEPALARAVCQRLGLEPVWHNLPMEDFYSCLETGQYDVVWFNQAITTERQQRADFTRPYGLFDEAVLVRQGSQVNSAQDLVGKRVGGLADSTNIALVKDFPGAEAVPFPGSDRVLPEMLDALHNGQIDALIDDELVLIVAAEDDPSLRLAFSLPTRVPFGIAVPKSRQSLLNALNQTLDELAADGTMAQLWAEWIPQKPFPFTALGQ
ncbi:amino acid ABC transporter substrate-binding protein [Romeria aff. gracilis LEGE 07310]|uniref:Amino acid ABC transporter substrate-binding protein n=1 Tax=Vasconcelosia minhoensis LEGE 07310 TaxID=915328 RepID=A0A8J7AHB0_9CYAN|nr:amino acid ABC transporter substrate-binding protein [Romeria aff. gracilis LEGE 07310]